MSSARRSMPSAIACSRSRRRDGCQARHSGERRERRLRRVPDIGLVAARDLADQRTIDRRVVGETLAARPGHALAVDQMIEPALAQRREQRSEPGEVDGPAGIRGLVWIATCELQGGTDGRALVTLCRRMLTCE